MIIVLLLSVLIGLSLGLMGGGGSILAVPVLKYVAGLEAKAAIATSLLVVGTTAGVGGWRHARQGNVAWRTGMVFAVTAMAGGYGGGLAADWFSGTVLLMLFALMMLVTSVMMLRGRGDLAPRESDIPVMLVVAEGIAVGALTGLVGAGGGFMVVPALVLLGGMEMHRAVGTSHRHRAEVLRRLRRLRSARSDRPRVPGGRGHCRCRRGHPGRRTLRRSRTRSDAPKGLRVVRLDDGRLRPQPGGRHGASAGPHRACGRVDGVDVEGVKRLHMIPISAAKRTDGVRYAIRDVVMKAREHAANGMQMLYLNIGDPIQFDFQTPPHIIDAITASMKAGNNGYGPSEGTAEAVDAVTREAASKGIDNPHHVFLTTGASEAIELGHDGAP